MDILPGAPMPSNPVQRPRTVLDESTPVAEPGKGMRATPRPSLRIAAVGAAVLVLVVVAFMVGRGHSHSSSASAPGKTQGHPATAIALSACADWRDGGYT